MATPKDAETLMGEIMCRWPQNIPFGPYQYSWFQNALASYAAHLAGALPEKLFDEDASLNATTVEEQRAYNEAIDACRAAILREAGAGE